MAISSSPDVPTLGFQVLDWILENLAAPDRSEYEPFVPTREQAKFILGFYALDPSGRRRYRRAVLSRPKGYGKSPLLSALCCVEALGPVVPDGFDAEGNPVGRPWAAERTPWIQLAAVSEDQTKNAWIPLLEMLRDGPAVDNYRGLEPMETFVNLPKGRIEFVTAAATSREGNRPVFAVFDQTESWTVSNGGVRLAATLRRNLGKTDGSSIEAPNAYRPGERSVAEQSAEAAKEDRSILYDHVEAPAVEDLSDHDAVVKALRKAYGSHARPSGWVDLDRLARECADPATDPSDAMQFYFNRPVAPERAAFDSRDWAAMADPSVIVADGEMIVAGFDGAQYDDATALIGTRISDGFQWPILIAEKPDGEAGFGWQVSEEAVSGALALAFERFQLVLLFGDPWGDWRPTMGAWAQRHGSMVQEFDTRHTVKMARAVELYRGDVRRRAFKHDGDSTFRRHIENARVEKRQGLDLLVKEHKRSAKKIDAAVAGCLSYAARTQAVEQGLGVPTRTNRAVFI